MSTGNIKGSHTTYGDKATCRPPFYTQEERATRVEYFPSSRKWEKVDNER